MTSDARPQPSAMTLIHASPTLTDTRSKALDERAPLLPHSSGPASSSASSSSSSTSTLSGYRSPTSSPPAATQAGQHRSYTWSFRGAAQQGYSARSDNQRDHDARAIIEYNQSTFFTKLLHKAHSMTMGSTSSYQVVRAHPNQFKEQRRRHSILRMSSAKAFTDKPLRKSASVEFALHHEDKLNELQCRHNEPNNTPRRLTEEEKEALYKIRPDLEIGPCPYYKERLEEIEQQNQRRTIFAIVGGVLCLVFLMILYYAVTIM